jgi:hypothetical protein
MEPRSLRYYLRKQQKEELLTEEHRALSETRALQLGGSERLLIGQFHEPVRGAPTRGAGNCFEELRFSQRSKTAKFAPNAPFRGDDGVLIGDV